MKQYSNSRQFFLSLIMFGFLLAACTPREVKPPPQTGKIIAEYSKSTFAFDVRYSVGLLGDQLKVVGVINNTYMSDLDHFKLELKVKNSEGVVVAEAATGYFFIDEHDSSTFAFRIPRLYGPHNFSFRYEYDYYEYSDTGRRGGLRAETHEWSFFEDQIELP